MFHTVGLTNWSDQNPSAMTESYWPGEYVINGLQFSNVGPQGRRGVAFTASDTAMPNSNFVYTDCQLVEQNTNRKLTTLAFTGQTVVATGPVALTLQATDNAANTYSVYFDGAASIQDQAVTGTISRVFTEPGEYTIVLNSAMERHNRTGSKTLQFTIQYEPSFTAALLNTTDGNIPAGGHFAVQLHLDPSYCAQAAPKCVMLAFYDASQRLVCARTVDMPSDGSALDQTISIDNTSGQIVSGRAFVVDAQTRPLSDPVAVK